MKRCVQPPEVFTSGPIGFSQVVTSPPGTLVFVSGQVAWDGARNLLGGADLGQQTQRALVNLGHSLRAAGASPRDVTACRIYIVDLQPGSSRLISPHLRAFFGDSPPASTWIGVQALASPELLVEIEAVAVIAG